ncbi:hypothetical protein MMC07_008324 [Pseudocyphellaria aurata]|nr:hypothetical protein [Pseudocyphellaria aurata]
MVKRKRAQCDRHTSSLDNREDPAVVSLIADEPADIKEKRPRLGSNDGNSKPTIQIITGSYEKILHGVTAALSLDPDSQSRDILAVEFADNFLFNAHGAAIRCLAISPPSLSEDASRSQKAILASGSSDQIINLYHISICSLQNGAEPTIPSLAGRRTTENVRNRELGSLQHHSSSINALHFPSRSKLLSAAEDNTIAITRTRDWTVLSMIKAPIPKAPGRPSGDTAPYGGTPAGVNDFAVHPSMKLMVSVGKGEKCMRLWNLVTGKKAGVLNFERDLLRDVDEGRWGSGEGKRVAWNSLGEEFVVGFEKGAVVFGMVYDYCTQEHRTTSRRADLSCQDSKPRCRILPSPMTKIHQLRYIELPTKIGPIMELLAVSTEDGRIVFFSTKNEDAYETTEAGSKLHLPTSRAVGQLGGRSDGMSGRIKDFEILKITASGVSNERLLIVAGSSDGSIRLWALDEAQLRTAHEPSVGLRSSNGNGANSDVSQTRQVGKLLGTYETGNRITCLKAFLMTSPRVERGAATPLDGHSGMEVNTSRHDSINT